MKIRSNNWCLLIRSRVLPNRRLFNDRLSQALATSKRSGFYGALMFIDLDNFKPLNYTYGHAAGDEFVVTLAP